MKKLLVVALAALGMVACVNEEVTEMPQGGAITFENAFIDNATRAAVDPSITVATLDGFKVWGFVKEYDGVIFDGTEVRKTNGAWTYDGTQYWVPNQPYYFAALAPIDGGWSLVSKATGGDAKLGLGTVKFENVDGTEDLLYAKEMKQSAGLNEDNGAVKFQFQHLLSKVKFTFKNGFPTSTASIKVTNVKMTAPAEAKINLAQANYAQAWTDHANTTTLAFGDVEKLASNAAKEAAYERFTIPAVDKTYTITFDVELFMGAQSVYTVSKSSTVSGYELEMGTAYNFTAAITPENLDLEEIVFDVEKVNGWVPEGGENVDVPCAVVDNAADLAAVLTANEPIINVVLNANVDLPISSLGQQTGGSGEYKLGGDRTSEINIDLNGKLLNITTTYWSALGAKNENATITIKNGTMTSSQTTGTWNSYDLGFANCNYAFEDVVFEKAIALEAANKVYSLKKVTINEGHDYYAMWVSAKGQTVNIDGLTINSNGRGIKIDEQYVNDAVKAKVTMNIKNSTIKSVNKAAILVKSTAGAEINIDNLDFSQTADTEFAVWVDEDSAAYAHLVVVNGANKKVEGVNTTVVATADALQKAINDGVTTILLDASGNFGTGTIKMKSGVTIEGNGATLGSIDLNGADNVTLKDINFDAANAVYGYNGAGGKVQPANIISGGQGVNNGSMDVVIDGCTFVGTFADGGGSIAFTDQQRSGSGNITIKNCVFEQLGGYFFIYAYYSGNNGYMNIEKNQFNTKCYNPIYLGQYQSSVPVVVKENHFAEFSTFSQALYLQAHSSGLYSVSYDADAAVTNTYGK